MAAGFVPQKQVELCGNVKCSDTIFIKHRCYCGSAYGGSFKERLGSLSAD